MNKTKAIEIIKHILSMHKNIDLCIVDDIRDTSASTSWHKPRYRWLTGKEWKDIGIVSALCTAYNINEKDLKK